MLLFENMFKANQRLQQAAQTQKLVTMDPGLLNIQVIKPTVNAQG
jgi:hypothetical protein